MVVNSETILSRKLLNMLAISLRNPPIISGISASSLQPEQVELLFDELLRTLLSDVWSIGLASMGDVVAGVVLPQYPPG